MGNITLSYYLCNVSSAVAKHAAGYTSSQGYTVGANDSQVVVAIDESKKKGSFLKFNSEGEYSSSKIGLSFGHGNGCCYYDGYYYVAEGGGGTESPIIRRYDKSFVLNRQYNCIGDYDAKQNVSGITHMTGDYFILSKGGTAFVCKKYDAGLVESFGGFRIYSSFSIDNQTISNAFGAGYELLPQTVYYDKRDQKLYRIVSYKKSGKIRDNAIAEFTLSNNAPSYTTATLNHIYKNTRNDIDKFEIEAMSSDSSGVKYISANAEYGGTKQCDAVFEIELN